jgi:hypothetical protein
VRSKTHQCICYFFLLGRHRRCSFVECDGNFFAWIFGLKYRIYTGMTGNTSQRVVTQKIGKLGLHQTNKSFEAGTFFKNIYNFSFLDY